MRSGLSCTAAVLVAVLATCPSAAAITAPVVDLDAVPPTGSAGPVATMSQRNACVTTGVRPGSDPGAVAPSHLMLNLSDAWQFSRGDGQTVAIIDTGVQPGPRLPEVEPGGDFVESGDGLTDCDGHGTLVAGLVAGQPGDDGFSGVAPGARLISIRQTSPRFAPTEAGEDPVLTRAQLDVTTLARAIVRAADLGARVINISVITCLPADRDVDQTELGAALRYAAVDKDVVVVAAAGNNRSGAGATASKCVSNPLGNAGVAGDPRNWAGVTSVSVPSWWQPYVLSVGSLTDAGQVSSFTMAGPWVGIAAPGENVTSVSNGPDGGLANGVPDEDGELFSISGTSYAAAYVTGVAALVRSKFPQLTSAQVIDRITRTAHGAARSPSNLVGVGTVDPVAALTWDVDTPAPALGEAPPVQLAAPPQPEAEDRLPVIIAFAGAGILALAVVATAAVMARRRKDLSP